MRKNLSALPNVWKDGRNRINSYRKILHSACKRSNAEPAIREFETRPDWSLKAAPRKDDISAALE